MPSYPPPPVIPSTTPIEAGAWAPTTFYAAYKIFTSPNGDRRQVAVPYTSGGSYGTNDTNNTVSLSPTTTALSTQFAPLGAAYKQAVAASGATVTLGLPLQSNGIPVVAAVTVTDLEIDMDFPAVGTGNTVFVFTRFRPSDQSNLTLGTVSIASGKRSDTNGHNNGGSPVITNASLLAGDRILVRNQSLVTAPTFTGAGVYASVAFGGTLPTMPNPSAPTGLTGTPGGGQITLNWTAGANSTGTLIYRDNVPWAIVGTNTWVDSPLVPGTDNHTYTISAISPGGTSTVSTGVTVAPYTSYTYYSQSNGVPVTTDFVTTLGTNSGTSASVSSNVMSMVSGASGVANAAQDGVNVQWTKENAGVAPGVGHSAWRRAWKFMFPVILVGSTTIEFYFAANAFANVTTAFTSGVQLKMATGNYLFAFKAPSVNSGSSQTLTATGGPATVTSASGQVPYPITLSANTYYGTQVEVLPVDPGTNTQTINYWIGTEANFDNGTLLSGPPTNVITLSSANVTAAAAVNSGHGGYHYWWNKANQSNVATAITYNEKVVTITPLTVANS